jgi:hypothetical protein
MEPKHQSPEEYANDLINSIIETEKGIPEDQQLPINLLSYWIDRIKKATKKTWIGYIAGDRESYLLTEEEIMELYNKAGEQYVGDLLDSMVDKDLLEVSIDENGDFLYGLSETGKIVTDHLFKNKKS